MYSGQEGMVMVECECEDFQHAAGAVAYLNAKMSRGTRTVNIFALDDLPMCKHAWAALEQSDVTEEQELIRRDNRIKAREGYVIKAVHWGESRCYHRDICIEDIRRMRVDGWVFTVTSSAKTDVLLVTNDHPLNWL